MNKYICIHGHFYQPPRENPWLEAVELQDSAFPYHDWNERIAAECYAPNAHARILDGDNRITRIVNNYSQISFNFGPTVLSYLKEKLPDVHQAIIQADEESRKRFSGHGSAMAQCYNHMIMPLANRRDKYTQVAWGIRDFASRFGREPEGMWLPECAVDNETLEVLAELGVKFTVLSPFQASRVRPLDAEEWQDTDGGLVNPLQPYLVKLPSNRSIAVFFYHASVARAVAFEHLLVNGEHFAHRLVDAFDGEREDNQLVNVATDGESYGHHFRYGEMALAYALDSITANQQAQLTVYAEYLANNPPKYEAEIHQASAWSCSHGVDRWRRHCGCNSGGYPGWNQNWRQPLREALDWLRDQLAPRYESRAREFLKDPWAARNDYIEVILDRSPESMARFFSKHAARELNEAGQVSALRVLEMQRHAMLMYTSCGWFFDELSGLETVQVIQYAARALQLANEMFGENLEPGFLEILGRAESNVPGNGNGRDIYEKFVKPAVMTRETIAAHYAVSSLFESYPDKARIYSFTVDQQDRQLFTAGNSRLAIGRIRITFEITRNSDDFTYCVLHLGEQNLNCGVRFDGDQEAYAKLVNDTRAAFDRADFPEIIRLMDRHFGETHYTLKSLFRDEQRKVLDQILASTRDEIHHAYHLLTDRYSPLMRFLADLHAPAPKALYLAMEFVLNSGLRRQFEGEALDIERVRSLLAECAATKVPLESDALAYAMKGHLERLSDQFLKTPEDLALLQRFVDAADLSRTLPFEVNRWKAQNAYYGMLATALPDMRARDQEDDKDAKTWVEKFLILGERLGFRVDPITALETIMSANPQPLPIAQNIPRATYRLQLNAHFRLADALALVPYLHELGISHIYTSPLLKARPGSAHGYDVCDFNELNPELGTEADLGVLVAALRERGMGLVVDMVPNHMGIGGPENHWWWDVLTHGQGSRYAGYFDINWQSSDPQLRGKVLVPVLGDRYQRVIENREIQLHFDGNEFTLRYQDHQLPVAPASVEKLLESAEEQIHGATEPRSRHHGRQATVEVRQNQPALVNAVRARVNELNSNPDALDALVQQQYYRLAFWPHGNCEVNYRRFFHIITLAGIRVEDEHVFADAHGLLRRWLEAGLIDGLRVDHPDGLRDPERYLARLRAIAPTAWIVVEKILEPGESLPATWPVAGTTGYDFMNSVGGLFADPAGERAMTGFYADFTGEPVDYPAIVLEKKRLVLRDLFAAEVNQLAELLVRISTRHWEYSAFTRDEFRDAIIELAACFPVYRTYLRPKENAISADDIAQIQQALAVARAERLELAPELFDFLGQLLLLRLRGDLENEFAARFQQLTGPAMAKGVEDTAFYCFNRLASLNEVGGNPAAFGFSVELFHETSRNRQAHWPNTMLGSSTHDTKRSEDVRARISLLSEIPEAWGRAVRRWSLANEKYRRGGWPDQNAEYFFYQTLVGAWPLPLERALSCMEKSASESKQHTCWNHPNEKYLDALREFITAVLGDAEFVADLEKFLGPIIEAGYVNSLAQTLVKLTAPGVPDFYQGNELWDLSLMDPDNRRPVDFELRRCLLLEAKNLSAEEAWQRRVEGMPKLWMIQRALSVRARQSELFGGSSSYKALLAQGLKSKHVVAFMRGGGAITIVPRLILGLGNDWAGTTLELPAGSWRDEFTGAEIAGGRQPLSALLGKFPVALLLRKEDG